MMFEKKFDKSTNTLGPNFTQKVNTLREKLERFRKPKESTLLSLPKSFTYKQIVTSIKELLQEDIENLTFEEIINLAGFSDSELSQLEEYIIDSGAQGLEDYIEEVRYFSQLEDGGKAERILADIRMSVKNLNDQDKSFTLPNNIMYKVIIEKLTELVELLYHDVKPENIVRVVNFTDDNIKKLDEYVLEEEGLSLINYLENIHQNYKQEKESLEELIFREDGAIEIFPDLDDDLTPEGVLEITDDLESYFEEHNTNVFEESLRVREDGFIDAEYRYDQNVKPFFGMWFQGYILHFDVEDLEGIPSKKVDHLLLLAAAEEYKRMQESHYEPDNRFEFISVKKSHVMNILKELEEYLPGYKIEVLPNKTNGDEVSESITYRITKVNDLSNTYDV